MMSLRVFRSEFKCLIKKAMKPSSVALSGQINVFFCMEVQALYGIDLTYPMRTSLRRLQVNTRVKGESQVESVEFVEALRVLDLKT